MLSQKNIMLVKNLKDLELDKTFKERKTPGVYDVKHLGLKFLD